MRCEAFTCKAVTTSYWASAKNCLQPFFPCSGQSFQRYAGKVSEVIFGERIRLDIAIQGIDIDTTSSSHYSPRPPTHTTTMAAPTLCRAFARSISSSTKISRPQYLRLRAQNHAIRPSFRSFTASSKGENEPWDQKYPRLDMKLTFDSMGKALHRGPRMGRAL